MRTRTIIAYWAISATVVTLCLAAVAIVASIATPKSPIPDRPPAAVSEDQPGWDCRSQGNRSCCPDGANNCPLAKALDDCDTAWTERTWGWVGCADWAYYTQADAQAGKDWAMSTRYPGTTISRDREKLLDERLDDPPPTQGTRDEK